MRFMLTVVRSYVMIAPVLAVSDAGAQLSFSSDDVLGLSSSVTALTKSGDIQKFLC